MCASRIVAAVLLLALVGCREQVVVNPNDPPIADARAIDPATNMPSEGMITVPYAGVPVTVTLDGSQSRDVEGPILAYRWLTGNTADGGGRVMPDGTAGWPADTARVDVTLDRGEWIFNLWVIDAEGLVSEPDTIVIGVGSDPVAECVDQVVDGVAEACAQCMCEIEMCRPLVVESGCDAACWSLIQCIGANCPDFQAMAAMSDFSCLTTNCLMEYQMTMAGPTPMGATPAGGCARMCPDACSSSSM